jgi:hypothetical protein
VESQSNALIGRTFRCVVFGLPTSPKPFRYPPGCRIADPVLSFRMVPPGFSRHDNAKCEMRDTAFVSAGLANAGNKVNSQMVEFRKLFCGYTNCAAIFRAILGTYFCENL